MNVTFPNQEVARHRGWLLALLAVVAGLAAPLVMPSTPATAAPTTGTISGTVTRYDGLAMANVTVTASGYGDYVSTTTAANGTYAIASLTAGRYTVCFTPPAGSGVIPECYDNVHGSYSYTTVSVGAGVTTSGVNAVLDQGGAISGRVIGPAGFGKAGVTVTASGATYMTALTDANGNYTITEVVPGQYKVCFSMPDASLADECFDNRPGSGYSYYYPGYGITTYDVVTVTAGQTRSGVNAQLGAGATVTGTVRNANGSSAPGANVALYYGGQALQWASTDANGLFTFSRVAAATYQICATPPLGVVAGDRCFDAKADLASATAIPLTDGQTRSGVDITFLAPATISGTVTKTGGAAVGQVQVTVTPSPCSGYCNPTYAVTDAAGKYSASVQAGSYTVCFSPPVGVLLAECNLDKTYTSSGGDPVSAAPGSTVTVNATLALGGTVTGTVSDATGTPLAGAIITLSQANTSGSSPQTTSAADGTYSFVGISTGPYRVCATPPAGRTDLLPECFNNRAYPGGDALPVTAGQTTSAINLQLDAPGVVAGTVLGSNSLAVGAVTVTVRPQSGGQTFTGITDANGAYSIGALRAGSYSVCFAPPPNSPYVSQCYNNRPNYGSGYGYMDLIGVAGGATTTLNATLINGGKITGKVTAGGTAVAGVTVTTYTVTTTTAADGTYTLQGLTPSSTYSVCFKPPPGQNLTPECFSDVHSAYSGDPVSVTLGATTANIDAALEPGASVTGTVRSPSGAPVLNALVHLVSNQSGSAVDVTTDANGQYSAVGLLPGVYKVTADGPSGSGYLQATRAVIWVGLSQALTGVDLKFADGGAIAGTVRQSGGQPVPDAQVSLQAVGSSAYLAPVNTDALGAYKVTSLPAGSYTVCVRSPYLSAVASACYHTGSDPASTAVAVTAGATVSGIDVTLPAGGTVTGKVLGPGGSPVAGVYVQASGGNDGASSQTQPDGSYSIRGLGSGSYQVCVSSSSGGLLPQCYSGHSYGPDASPSQSDRVDVVAGATTSGIDFTLVAGATVAGKVTGPNGVGVPGVTVALDTGVTSPYYQLTAVTDGQGQYSISGFASGRVTVCATPAPVLGLAPRCFNGKDDIPLATPVSVGLGQTATANIALVAAGGITGKVTGAGSAPAPNVTVQVQGGGRSATATTDAAGTYTVPGLAAGSYEVCFTPMAGVSLVSACYQNAPTAREAKPVVVATSTTTTGIDVQLPVVSSVTGTISGKVTGPGGAAMIGTRVTVSGTSGYAVASADQNGNYAVTVPAGTVTVCFAAKDTLNLANQCWNNRSVTGTPDPVTVGAGATVANINATLVTGGQIKGTVRNADGTAAVGTRVTAVLDNSTGYRSTYADNSGGYTLIGLTTGSYAVCFQPENRSTECYNHKPDPVTADRISVTTGGVVNGVDTQFSAGAPLPTGRISGTVTSAANGTPLANISVNASRIGGGSCSGSCGSYGSAATDASGAYTISGLGDGPFQVCFSDYQNGFTTVCYNQKTPESAPTPVTIANGASVTGINAAMSAGASIAGTLTGPGAVPLANVRVYVNGGGYSSTDASGTYRVAGLQPGSYRVQFVPPPELGLAAQWYAGATTMASATPVVLQTGQAATKVDGALVPGGIVRGKVMRAGAPYSGGAVQIRTADGSGLVAQAGVLAGDYVVLAVPAGTYQVWHVPSFVETAPSVYNGAASPATATPVTVAAGATTANVDLAVTEAGSISGTVRSNGSPLSGAGVKVIPVGSSAAGAFGTVTPVMRPTAYCYYCGGVTYSGWSSDPLAAQTGADGTYKIGGLPPGQYKVAFWKQDPGLYYGMPSTPPADAYFDKVVTEGAATPVSVAVGQAKTGIDMSFPLSGPPSAPTNVAATPGNGQVVVTWSAPNSDGGQPITKYTVTASPGGGTCSWTSGPLSCTITGLTNGTPYTFSVTATNSLGTGPAAASSSTVPATVPGAPTSVVGARGNGAVAVSWVAPSVNGGAAISAYTVTASPGGATCTWTAGPLACTVSGLSNGTPYTFTVTGTNSIGTSAPSSPSAAVVPATVPGVPSGVAVAAADSAALVSWSAPPSNGGATISSYVVTTAPGGATCTWLAGPLGCTVVGLVPGTSYTFTVKAINGVGASADSAPSSLFQAKTVPGVPTAASAIASSQQAVVSWAAPVATGFSPITGYTVTSSPGGSTCTWSSGPLTCTVSGLTNGQAYTFTVKAANAVGTGAASAPSASVTPIGSPTAPIAPTAVAGNAAVDVSWSAPASNGGSPITGYTVTASPGGKTCSWSSGPLSCKVPGLTNGQTYTFTVTATNAVGAGPASVATAPVTPVSGSYFHPLAPTRILDSRGANGGWNAKLAAGTPKALTVTGGSAGVPANVDAVVVNVTATGSSAGSFLTVYPAGGAIPGTSSLNFGAGETIPNLVTVKVGTNGQIAFANAVGTVDVIVDIVGYFDAVPADRYNAVTPARILDSRGTTGGWNAKLTAGAPKNLQVRGVGGVPATADAVIMNVTATGGTANSFLTLYPSGGAVPTASNVNFAAGQTIPNLVTVKIGANGQVGFANAVGGVDVIADVVGYFDATTGDLFHAIAPARLLDSRGSTGGWNGKLVAGAPRPLIVTGVGGVPANATAVIGNTTVTGGTANSFVTVYPAGQPVPNASNVNFAAGQTIPNLVAVKVGTGGQIGFANAVGAVDVIFDADGYFAST